MAVPVLVVNVDVAVVLFVSSKSTFSFIANIFKQRNGYGIRSNISNTRDSASSEYQNTEERVENTTRIRVFLTKFEVFG